MVAQMIILVLGWIFLVVSWLIPENKCDRVINDKRLMWKIIFSALATGLFVAGAIHSLIK